MLSKHIYFHSSSDFSPFYHKDLLWKNSHENVYNFGIKSRNELEGKSICINIALNISCDDLKVKYSMFAVVDSV